MAAPNYHNYTTVSGSTVNSSETASFFQHVPATASLHLIDHITLEPGKYNGAELWTGGHMSGSWGGLMRSGSADSTHGSTIITVAGGVTIPARAFRADQIHEVGFTDISGSVVLNTAGVYLFKLQRQRELIVKERK